MALLPEPAKYWDYRHGHHSLFGKLWPWEVGVASAGFEELTCSLAVGQFPKCLNLSFLLQKMGGISVLKLLHRLTEGRNTSHVIL